MAAFFRVHRIPLVTTYKGKGLMSEGDPLSFGGAGLSSKADRILMPLIGQADCVLLIGYDSIEMRISWRNPFGPDQTVIDLAPARRDHGMHRADITRPSGGWRCGSSGLFLGRAGRCRTSLGRTRFYRPCPACPP